MSYLEGIGCGVAPQGLKHVKEESVAEPAGLPAYGVVCAPLVNFKDEAENILHSDTVKDEKCVKPVKEVAGFNDEKPPCLDNGVSEAAMLASLYSAHEVKDDLVLGPELPYQPEASLVVLSWAFADKDGCPYPPAQESGGSETQLATRDGYEVLNSNCRIKNGSHDQKPDTEDDEHEVKQMCELCGTRFTKSDLIEHVRMHIHMPIATEVERSGNSVTEHANRDLNRRQHSLRECLVRIERLPNLEAIRAANTTTHTDSETDTEQTYTKVEYEEKEKESICDICGMSFALKFDLKTHVMIHTHMPERSTKQQEDMDVANSASKPKILKAGACRQKLAHEYIHSPEPTIRECYVRLERLHSGADTESDVKNETYAKLDCEIPTCYICGESFALKAELIKHVTSHVHTPTNKEQEDDVTEYTSDEDFPGASSYRQDPNDHRQHTLGLECSVMLERLPKGLFSSLRHSRDASHSLAPPLSTEPPQKINLKKRVNTAKSKRYICDYCDRKFLHKKHIIQHIKLHLGESTKPSSVKTSRRTHNRKSTTNKISLSVHQQKYKGPNHSSVSKTPALLSSTTDVYKGQKSYSCEICNGQFDKLNDFKIHRRLHMGLNVFTCSWCQKMFSCSNNYESHKRSHTGERPYSCEICKKTFKQMGQLNYHKRVHTGEKKFACEICKKHFMYRTILNSHILFCHTDIKPYSCEICKKEFKVLSHYKCHKRVHTGETPYSCEICDQQFKYKHGLINHIQLHTGKKPFYCEICHKRFAIKKYYDAHKKKHLRVKTHYTKTYSCKVCKEQFQYKTQYKEHKRRHVGETRYSCNLCNKKFVVLGNCEAHKLTHTGIQPYSCGQCDKIFSHIKALNCHKQSHSGKIFSCDYCQKTFSNKAPLTNHIKAHIRDKSFVCEVCNKRLSSSFHHNRHKQVHMKNKTYTCKLCHEQFDKLCNYMIHKRIHLGEFLYSCKLCDKKFIDKGLYEAHERMHTGAKPYTCNICDKSFAKPSYLVVHTRFHTGEKPYKCDICQKQFAQCGDWNKHKRTHTGEKRYSCEICNKQFAEQRALRFHQLIHTGEKPLSCNFCDKKFRHPHTLRLHRRLHTGEKPYSCGKCNAQFAQHSGLRSHKQRKRNCKGT